jgi:RNA polymerase sigma factor (sigma-70 family)
MLVSNYLGLVYGTARRRLNGDAALASDVAQIVFTDLARQAHKLHGGAMLGGWLHRHTCFVAAKVSRAELRRKAREQTASELNTLSATTSKDWNDIAGVVDETVNELQDDDRAAILLRFLEGRTMRSVGEVLGISEDAAQKRTHRAVEKLKLLLERKGVVVSVGALGALLATEAMAGSIPAGLTAIISSAALSGAAANSFTSSTVLKTTLLTHPGTALLVTAILCTGAALVVRKLNSKPLPAAASGERTQTAPPRLARSAPQASGVAPPLTPTVADDAVKRLKAHAESDDDDTLVLALYGFWNDYDAAPEAEKPLFRAALPTVINMWERKSERLKDVILSTFNSRLNPPTDRVVDIYLEALASTNEMRVNTATIGLMRAGPAAAKATTALIDQLQRNHHQNDTSAVSSSTARMSIDALANIGPGASAAVPLLTTFLQDTSMMYRVIGARAYWHVTGDAEKTLPVLTNALVSENSFWAADVLGEMGSSATPALDSLRQAYRAGAPDARMHAYKALLTIDPYHAPDIQGVQELVDTRNSITRLDATEALWQYSHDSQLVLPLLLKVLPERENFYPDVDRILTMLGQMGPDATEALPALRKILQEPNGTTITRVIASNTWAQISPGTPVPGP